MSIFKRTQRKYVKKAYRVRNWREYEAGLRNRGSLTVWISLTAALVHNSDRGRELAWPRLPSSDHLAIRHPERRHGVENLAPDPCLDSLCRQPSRSHR